MEGLPCAPFTGYRWVGLPFNTPLPFLHAVTESNLIFYSSSESLLRSHQIDLSTFLNELELPPSAGGGRGEPLAGTDKSGGALLLGARRSREVRCGGQLEGRGPRFRKECVSDSHAAARLLQGDRPAGKLGPVSLPGQQGCSSRPRRQDRNICEMEHVYETIYETPG